MHISVDESLCVHMDAFCMHSEFCISIQPSMSLCLLCVGMKEGDRNNLLRHHVHHKPQIQGRRCKQGNGGGARDRVTETRE